jgi:uncharacterized membrane protein
MPMILFFFLLITLLIAFIEIGAMEYAYEKISIRRRYIFGLLLLSLLGSYVNIPVAELPVQHIVSNQVVPFFGMSPVIPRVQEAPRTSLAINLGGAVIPTLVSLYLLLKDHFSNPFRILAI